MINTLSPPDQALSTLPDSVTQAPPEDQALQTLHPSVTEPPPSDKALSMLPEGETPSTPSNESEVPDLLHTNPLHAAAGIVQGAEGALGTGINKLGDLYNMAVGQPTASTAWMANAPKTILEKAAQVEQIPENLVKRGALALEGQNQTPGSPSWARVIFNLPGMKNLSPEDRYNVSKDLGVIGEPTLDPLWYLKPLGITGKGLEAAKTGMLEPNIGKAAEMGQRATLSLGDKALIGQTPITDVLGAIQNKIPANLKGALTPFNTAAANKTLESTKTSPMNFANVAASQMPKLYKDMLTRNASELGIALEELEQRMVDWREPPGSQQKTINPEMPEGEPPESPNQQFRFPESETELPSAINKSIPESSIKNNEIMNQRATIEKGLTPETIQFLRDTEAQNAKYGVMENQNMRNAYLPIFPQKPHC